MKLVLRLHVKFTLILNFFCSFVCEALNHRKKLFLLSSSNIFIFWVLCRLERESKPIIPRYVVTFFICSLVLFWWNMKLFLHSNNIIKQQVSTVIIYPFGCTYAANTVKEYTSNKIVRPYFCFILWVCPQ